MKAKGEAFAKLPRDLLESLAWRSLSIHSRRFVDFLLIEHMRHGGKDNGRLVAPRRQLIAFGIHAHFVSAAIDEAERVGLIDCKRGIGRGPNVYGLTWLPRGPGEPPTDRWRHGESAAIEIMGGRKQAKIRITPPVMSANVHPLRVSALCAFK
jgi:hypothetical protein